MVSGAEISGQFPFPSSFLFSGIPGNAVINSQPTQQKLPHLIFNEIRVKGTVAKRRQEGIISSELKAKKDCSIILLNIGTLCRKKKKFLAFIPQRLLESLKLLSLSLLQLCVGECNCVSPQTAWWHLLAAAPGSENQTWAPHPTQRDNAVLGARASCCNAIHHPCPAVLHLTQ